MADRNIDPATVSMNRYTNGMWNKLSTTKIGNDSDYIYFSAISPGFSHFAISGKKIRDIPALGATALSMTTTVAAASPATVSSTVPPTIIAPAKKPPIGKIILAILVTLIIAGGTYYVYCGKMQERSETESDTPERGQEPVMEKLED